MCVAILHYSGAKMISKETLKKCWKRNPHGAGYFWVGADEKIHIRKGFMDFEDFWWNYKQEGFTRDRIFGIHFRIATSGGRQPIQTHPFPVSRTSWDLKYLDFTCNVAIMHNGILGKGKRMFSDTMLLAMEMAGEMKDGKTLDKIVNKISKTSGDNKICVLTPERAWLIGDWIEVSDGLYFSNLRFKQPKKIIKNERTIYRSWEDKKSAWAGRTN